MNWEYLTMLPAVLVFLFVIGASVDWGFHRRHSNTKKKRP